MRSLDLPRDAGAGYKKRAGVISRHHDDTMMRDENQAKKREKYLILLNKLAGVVQWQNGSFPTFSANFHYDARSASLVLATPKSRLCWGGCAKFSRKINQRREKKCGPGQARRLTGTAWGA